jgi:lysophospholipase L1-like esterase
MFQTNNGQTVRDAAEVYLKRQKWELVVVMVGINDVLAGGRKAGEVMEALKALYTRCTDAGMSVVAVAPMAAPGFVAR